MKEDGVDDSLRRRQETDPHARGQHLRQAVEADDPPHLGLVALECEVRGRPRGASKVQVVIRIVWPDHRSLIHENKQGYIRNGEIDEPSRIRKLCFRASSRTSRRRSRVEVIPVGFAPYCCRGSSCFSPKPNYGAESINVQGQCTALLASACPPASCRASPSSSVRRSRTGPVRPLQ